MELKEKITNSLLVVVLGSFITILITTLMYKDDQFDKNVLSSLIGGYSGLFASTIMIFIYALQNGLKDITQILLTVSTLTIILSIIIMFIIYFNVLTKNSVSNYFIIFLRLTMVGLFTQYGFAWILKNNTEKQQAMCYNAIICMSTIFTLAMIIPMWVILNFYTTQG